MAENSLCMIEMKLNFIKIMKMKIVSIAKYNNDENSKIENAMAILLFI